MLARILCFLCGYLCGILETGVIYGKIKGVDIRQHGSGNSGTTNALRVLGKKAGLVVFIGDFCKSFIPCLIARFVFIGSYPNTYLLFVLYVGIGAVVGHVFPFYLKFKGGKGVATTAGTVVGILDPLMIVVLLALFILIVALTRYVSLGSILLMVEFSAFYIISALAGRFCFAPGVDDNAIIESTVIIVLIAIISITKHRTNIVRLIKHEENKLSFKKAGIAQ